MRKVGGSLVDTPTRRRNVDKSARKDTLKTCQAVLLALGERIQRNDEQMAGDKVKEWKERILEQYGEIMRNKLLEDWMDQAVAVSVSKARSELGDGNFDKLHEVVKADLEKQKAKANLDPSESEDMKKLKRTLYPQEMAEDEDLQVMGQANNESKYKCPITTMLMTTPMRSSKCIHHLSKEGLDMLLKNKNKAKCPVVGCNMEWAANTSEVDEDFLRELKQFERRKRTREQMFEGTSTDTQDTISLDD